MFRSADSFETRPDRERTRLETHFRSKITALERRHMRYKVLQLFHADLRALAPRCESVAHAWMSRNQSVGPELDTATQTDSGLMKR